MHHHHAKKMCKKKINNQGNNHLLCFKWAQNSLKMINWAQVDHPQDQQLQGQLLHRHVFPHENIVWHHYKWTHFFKNCIWHENVLKTHHKVVLHIIHV